MTDSNLKERGCGFLFRPQLTNSCPGVWPFSLARRANDRGVRILCNCTSYRAGPPDRACSRMGAEGGRILDAVVRFDLYAHDEAFAQLRISREKTPGL